MMADGGSWAWLDLFAAVLLGLGMVGHRIRYMRLWVSGAALAAAGAALLARGDVLLTILYLFVLALNVIQLSRLWLGDRRGRFSDEEERMLDSVLPGLPRGSARHLIDQGMWLSGKAGEVLTREGQAVSHLYYLSSGSARAEVNGVAVGALHGGELIGEATALSATPASATVILASEARFWCMPAEELRTYVELHKEVGRLLERRLGEALKGKLVAANQAKVSVGGA